MNTELAQTSVRDSHKLIGLSFLDISKLDNGLDALVSDIESGSVSEIRAMEVAMHSINYTMARYQEAQDITDSFIDNPENYRESMDSACHQMAIAKANLKLMMKSFKCYPSIIDTANSLLSMFVYYEGYMIIPSMASIRREQFGEKNILTYFFKNPLTGLVKIGRSVDVKTRKQAVQCGSGVELEVLLVLNKDVERKLHKKFSKYRKHGEWFEDSDGLIKAYVSEQLKLEV